MNNLEYIIKKHMIENYGDLIVADEPIFDENTKVWKVQLCSTYPRIIEDLESKEIIIRFLNLKDLGTIEINENLKIVDATSNQKCEHQLTSRIDIWKQQAEKIVATASSDVFAKIAESIHVLNPLWLVLGEIIKLDQVHNNLLEGDEIDQQRRPYKIRQYLELLVELDIVRKVDNDYTYGNVYVGLLENNDRENFHELQVMLLSHVIKRKYSTLRQVFGITQLEPFVHLANAYYWPSLDAEKLIHTTRSHLYQRFQDYYNGVSSWDFNSKLSELTNNGALQYENGYLIGNKDQFDAMLELKQTVILNP